MTSGAPRPGGYHAPAPGGRRVIAAGGTNLNDATLRHSYEGFPDFDISPANVSGARVAQTRNVVNVRLGRTASITNYNWSLPTKPGGSTTTHSASLGQASFTPDMAGTYILRCAVTFSDGTVVTKDITYVSA